MVAVDPLKDAELAASYGFALSVLNSDPDLKRIFKETIAGNWSYDRFAANLKTTNWYKRTSDTARNWIVLRGEDSATYNQRLATRVQAIADTAGALGVTLSKAQLTDIANKSIMFGWSDAQAQAAVSVNWNSTTTPQGLAAQTLDKINTASSDYLVPLSDNAKNQWVQQVLSGTKTADDFTEYAKTQAASMFTGWSKQILAGTTVKQLADPYAQTAAQLLGVDPNTIDFTQPKWRQLIEQVDPKTQERAPLSLADAQTKIRTDPLFGYDVSQNGRQQGAQLTTQLAQMMGALG